jgi:hypothetical protein
MGLQEVTPASLSAAYAAAEYGLEARRP